MVELLQLFLGGIFWNNIVLNNLLGLTPFLVERKSSFRDSLGTGITTTVLMIFLALITFIVHEHILIPLNLTYLNNLIFVLLIMGLIFFMRMRPENPEKIYSWHYYLPDIFFNAAVFGMILLEIAEWETLIEAVVSAAGYGIGFTALLLIIDGMNNRMEKTAAPEWLKGVPIQLIILGILALAVSGLEGI